MNVGGAFNTSKSPNVAQDHGGIAGDFVNGTSEAFWSPGASFTFSFPFPFPLSFCRGRRSLTGASDIADHEQTTTTLE